MALVKPVSNENWKISSGYGWRWHPILKKRLFHKGIDINVPCGTNVYAVDDGIIKDVGYSPTKGVYIDIDHDNNLISSYYHLESYPNNIIKGEEVDQDQLIGISGGKYYSGFSTGCHLHYQLQKNGNYINPAKESLYIKDWQKIFAGLVGAFAIYKYIIPYFDQKLKK